MASVQTTFKSSVPKLHVIKLPVWRRRVLLGLILMGFAVLLGRDVYLQSFNKKFLQERGDARSLRVITLSAQRGKIVDRNGELLASSMPVESVWVNPSDAQISPKQIDQLAELLQIKPDFIQKQLVNDTRTFVYLKQRIPPEEAEKVMKLGISGVHLERGYKKRYYPAEGVAAHLVGFTGRDDQGQEGIELIKNEVLSGKAGSRRVVLDRDHHIIEGVETVKVQNGRDVVLSIDRRIQYLVYRELTRAVEKHQAKAGAAVVLDAKTGEVLAMVNVPTYNPNNPVNILGKSRNLTITDLYEPGSTMKPIIAAAALASGQYQPTTPIQTGSGTMKVGPHTIHDTHPYGLLTVSGVIQKSSNVGISKMALSLDRQYMWGVFNQIGFGAKTRIGFPGERSGQVMHYKNWRPMDQAAMSFGNAISVTLLQMARAYTVFANEGELKPVSLLKLQEAPVGVPVFSAQVANDTKDMLESVVLPGGTATQAQVLGYRVAGKTGTSKKLAQGRYENKYVGSFVGMVPASNPRLIMAVMIDDPSVGGYYGGVVAAPVFGAVMADTLRMLAVPQDAPNNNVVIPPNVEDAKEVT